MAWALRTRPYRGLGPQPKSRRRRRADRRAITSMCRPCRLDYPARVYKMLKNLPVREPPVKFGIPRLHGGWHRLIHRRATEHDSLAASYSRLISHLEDKLGPPSPPGQEGSETPPAGPLTCSRDCGCGAGRTGKFRLGQDRSSPLAKPPMIRTPCTSSRGRRDRPV